MFKAVSALAGAGASGMVELREAGLQGMVSLRADLDAAGTAKAIEAVAGAALPAPRMMAKGPAMSVAWMSPDELLILCAHGAADDTVAQMSEALKGQHYLAVNVSDARAMFTLKGSDGVLRDCLAKVTPANMDPAVLKPGEMRRTRIAQVPAAIWFETPGEARVVCFRSVAKYVFDVLEMSSREGGSVGYFG